MEINNRKAKFDYTILEEIEAGMVLKGTEVKSIRQGMVNLKDGFALPQNGEIILKNVYIAPYEKGSYNNVDSKRDRRLLLHKAEINKIIGKVSENGVTLVPSKLMFDRNLVKLELALCTGKKLYDKREDIKEKEAKRKIDRILKSQNM